MDKFVAQAPPPPANLAADYCRLKARVETLSKQLSHAQTLCGYMDTLNIRRLARIGE